MTIVNTCAVPVFLLIPFVLLLGMIATGPVLYARFWHRYYAYIAVFLALVVMGYYVLVYDDVASPVEAMVEFIQFVTLIGALYVASGGIWVDVSVGARPLVNLVLLWVGALLANVIGTTGASMLLIRPFIRINKRHVQAYHIVFFIFMVSNVGGCLTPVGDPPLFLGYLKGVPFFWTLLYCPLPWFTALTLLSLLFYLVDRSCGETVKQGGPSVKGRGVKIYVQGKKNFFYLLIIGLAVFLDPAICSFVPSIKLYGHRYSYIRELVFIGVSVLAYGLGDRGLLRKNDFGFGPLKEVVCIFFGIFGTMIPVLALINQFAQSPVATRLVNVHTLYWVVGSLSSFLDNAPTYLTALKAGTVVTGYDVLGYATHAGKYLMATSLGAVFFGAMTYIGNGPNYMVKKIAEDSGVKMPSFFKYLTHYAALYLLPVLVVIWLVFFVVS